MHVLIVDDDEGIRTLLADLLEEEGYAVESATNGQEALTTLQHSDDRPCVILLDLMMPVMSGWEFREAQRRTHTHSDIPVVVISAIPVLTAQTTLDAVAYFSKPIDLDALVGTVERYCTREDYGCGSQPP